METIIALIILYVIYRIYKESSAKKKPSIPNEVTLHVELSGTEEFSRNYEQPERPNGPPAKWYEYSKGVSVNGYDILGGLIYVGTNLPDDYGYENDACPKISVFRDIIHQSHSTN